MQTLKQTWRRRVTIPLEEAIANEPELKYQSLDEQASEIRIIKLHSGAEHQPVSCELHNVPCDHKYPEYITLSYCWGDENDTTPILVNDCPVRVTGNLETALRELRRRGIVSIWADALCINQKDNGDKSRQVLRMADIYKNSTDTIAWLGTDEEGWADQAFQRLILLAAQKPEEHFHSSMEELQLERSERRLIPGWLALQKLMALPYWNRTWIIQEIILSQQVTFQWDKATLNFKTLMEGMTTLKEKKPSRSGFEKGYTEISCILQIYSLTEGIRDKGSTGKGRLRLHDALNFSAQSKATKEVDKILAVLGTTTDGAILIPNPDYELPLDEVLQNMTITRLSKRENQPRYSELDLICIDNPSLPKRGDIPSWVIDWPSIWKSSRSQNWSSVRLRGIRSGYKASNGSKCAATFSSHGRTMKLSGYVFDRIRSLGPGVAVNFDPQEEPILDSKKNVYGDEDGLREAIWRTLVCDRTVDVRERAPYSFGNEFQHLFTGDTDDERIDGCTRLTGGTKVHSRTIKEWASSTPHSSFPSIPASPSAFAEALKLTEYSRRFLVSQRGFVGLAHAQSREGDLISILEGCSLPMVLRECKGGHWVVGEAYVHGIMEGECWKSRGALDMQRFCLK